jgi:hypothetical protein
LQRMILEKIRCFSPLCETQYSQCKHIVKSIVENKSVTPLTFHIRERKKIYTAQISRRNSQSYCFLMMVFGWWCHLLIFVLKYNAKNQNFEDTICLKYKVHVILRGEYSNPGMVGFFQVRSPSKTGVNLTFHGS